MSGPPEVVTDLRHLITLSQKTLEDARKAVWDMRSPALAGGDFPATLRATADERLRTTGIDLEFDVDGAPRPLDPEIEGVLLRVAQEAIVNVVKHAAATRVAVTLAYQPKTVRLSVTDDGHGFAVDPDFRAYGGHWGLLGMRERASQIRAKLSVQSTLGHGTEIVVLIPYARRHQNANSVPT